MPYDPVPAALDPKTEHKAQNTRGGPRPLLDWPPPRLQSSAAGPPPPALLLPTVHSDPACEGRGPHTSHECSSRSPDTLSQGRGRDRTTRPSPSPVALRVVPT